MSADQPILRGIPEYLRMEALRIIEDNQRVVQPLSELLSHLADMDDQENQELVDKARLQLVAMNESFSKMKRFIIGEISSYESDNDFNRK